MTMASGRAEGVRPAGVPSYIEARQRADRTLPIPGTPARGYRPAPWCLRHRSGPPCAAVSYRCAAVVVVLPRAPRWTHIPCRDVRRWVHRRRQAAQFIPLPPLEER